MNQSLKEMADRIKMDENTRNKIGGDDSDYTQKQQNLKKLEAEVERVIQNLPRIVEDMARSKANHKVILFIDNMLVENPKSFFSQEGYNPNSFPACVKKLFDYCEEEGLNPILMGRVEIIGNYELVIRL
jgi:acyl-CoA hydrolase